MKQLLFTYLCLLLSVTVSARQNVAINNSSTLPDGSAMLDVNSTSKGVLVPRMTMAQRDAISSPQTGLLIFQSDGSSGFYYNAGSSTTPSWKKVGSEADYPQSPFSNQVFLAPGTSTFSVPANVHKIFFEIAGGGGGAGGSYIPVAGNGNGGGGGGAGGFANGYFSVTPGEMLSVTVGAGGVSGTSGTGGGTDGTTGSFSSVVGGLGDSLLRVNGGVAGKAGTSSLTGNGGLFGSYFNVFSPRVVFGVTANFNGPIGLGSTGTTGTNPFSLPGLGGVIEAGNYNLKTRIFPVIGGFGIPQVVGNYGMGGGNGSNPSSGYVAFYW